MQIFIVIHSDAVVQLNDKVRFDLSKGFVAKPDITANAVKKIEVKPTSTSSWITIHDATLPATKLAPKDWFFDWVYSSVSDVVGGLQTFAVKFTNTEDEETESSKQFALVTEEQDGLFSSDNDLMAHEPEILKYLPEGKSSWTWVHRRAQNRILSYLFEKGYKNTDGSPYTKSQVVDKYDVKEWSTFMTLKLIFGSIINSKDDIFTEKSRFYENLEGKANKTDIRVDSNSDGTSDKTLSLQGPILVRR